ncbi:hypothetical protein ACFQ1M_06370 [Sungkyunkwania multivorans]|uniref:Right handed beta helix domain-containing protein n=1 Tax=Sungkyunkwania multivorans TaxID=1173618 RepID=A0ABW3CVN3_9FLAO
MRQYLYALGLVAIIIALGACRNDFEFSPSTGDLGFSKDTIYLDTVFTNIGSSTYNLRVYNNSDNDISIPSVRLERGDDSRYRLNVDGQAGKAFTNVEILAKDSIFVFVETTVDITEFAATATEFLYTDKILFDEGADQQDVDLVTLIKDAVFLFPERTVVNGETITETLILGSGEDAVEIEGFFLDNTQLNFTNEKPYVIYGYAAVPGGETLTIDAGARVHFHAGSGLIVANNGTLQVNGALSTDLDLLENEVIFEGDRLEPGFANVPGQWGAIWLTDGSTANIISHATIRNATVGLLMDNNDGTTNPTLTLNGVQIYNSSVSGLLARTGHIVAENSVFGSSGQPSVQLTIGGNYDFKHCTIANYWNNSFRNTPALLINNYLELEDGSNFTQDLVQANFANTIVFGSNSTEFFLDPVPEAAFNYQFSNCLLRFGLSNPANPDLFDFSNEALYSGEIINMDPDFRNTQEEDFIIGDNSAANGQGDTTTASQVPTDILGVDRTASPDLGAYQHITFDSTRGNN